MFQGLQAGANITMIDSRVYLPPEEQLEFAKASIQAPTKSRDMTNAPEFLYKTRSQVLARLRRAGQPLFWRLELDAIAV